jgi:hypothetical protein
MRAALIAALLFATATASANIDGLKGLMPAEAESRLNSNARALYIDAIRHRDHVNHRRAAEALAAAAAEQPDHIELNLLAMRYNLRAGQTAWGQDSAQFFEAADIIVKRLALNRDLTTEQRNQVQSVNIELNGRPADGNRAAKQGSRETILQRDAARLETGLKLMTQIAQARREERGLTLSRLGKGGAPLVPYGMPSTATKAPDKAPTGVFARLPGEWRPEDDRPKAPPAGAPGGPINPFASGNPLPVNPFGEGQPAFGTTGGAVPPPPSFGGNTGTPPPPPADTNDPFGP